MGDTYNLVRIACSSDKFTTGLSNIRGRILDSFCYLKHKWRDYCCENNNDSNQKNR